MRTRVRFPPPPQISHLKSSNYKADLLLEEHWRNILQEKILNDSKLDQRDGAAVETLSEEQQQIARELIRRAIFIEMEPGLSRHGNVTTLRWHLRRVYLPTFSAALAKNDAVKRQVDWLKYLLTDPRGACEAVWKNWPKRSDAPDEPTLFDRID
jgi:hypothetical protein